MRDEDNAKTGKKMGQNEEDAERVVRHEADVPGVMEQAGASASRECPVGRYAEEAPRNS
jgi:hypothetical protein